MEALIFSSDKPLKVSRIRELLQDDEVDVETIIEELNNEYAERENSFYIRKIAGGYQFYTRKEFAHWVKKLYTQGRLKLSRPALETLAIIAYKQPITRAEIESIRGVNSDYLLKSLLEKNLIRISGRLEAPGRPLLYATTERFLEHFGLNSLDELPRIREIEELLKAEDQSEQDGISHKTE